MSKGVVSNSERNEKRAATSMKSGKEREYETTRFSGYFFVEYTATVRGMCGLHCRIDDK
jgi:hypothetical protein